MLAAELLGLGHGLAADYFSDAALTNLAATRVDSQVSFNWGSAAPLASLPTDGFSVRWNGKFQAQYSESYTFYATSAADDGVRLTIYTSDLPAAGGRKANQLFDTWSNHTAVEQNGSLTLTAGETYDVVVEYYNNTGTAHVALSWASPSTTKALIPNAQLYPTQSLAVSSIGGNWLDTDVGSPALAGSLKSQGDIYTINGGGSGIGGMADQFHYGYQVLQGDGVAVVKVDRLTGTGLDPQAQVGVMVRDGTATNGLYAGLFLTSANGITFSHRDALGQAATEDSQTGLAAPYWLKLVRRGATINAYVSTSGADDSWTFFDRADIAGLGDAVLIGVAATSSNAATSVAATLTNVTLSTDLQLAGGIGHLTSYYPCLPFIDLIKGGAGPAYELEANGSLSTTGTTASLDANGWPTEDFGYRGPYAQKPDALVGKLFTLTFNGIATVSIVSPSIGTATPASAATGDSNYVNGYDAATNTSKWYLTSTDTSGGNGTGLSCRFRNSQRTAASATGTGVTNIQLLQPGYTAYDSQNVYTQEYLDLLDPLKEIRLKDWAMVDGNLTANWSQRTLPSNPNQIAYGSFNSPYGGVAWEYLVELANVAHKDIWLSIPAHASNDYLLKLAQLIRYGSDGVDPYTSIQANPVFRGLDPDLNVYLEYGNEVWNYVFESNGYVQSQAWAAYQAGTKYGPNQVTLNYDGRTWSSSNNLDLIYRWVAAHLKQDVVDTWASVFGSSAINTRIRPVLSGWQNYTDRTCEEGLKFLQAAGWTPQANLYAISVAGYYGYNDLAAAQVTTNTARDSATKEETLDTFEVSTTASRGALAWPVSSAIASTYGIKLVAYEAGPSLGATNAQGSAQMDSSFVGIQNAIVNSWFASGAEQYNYSFFLFLNNYGNAQGDFILADNFWDRNQPREQSLYNLATATSSTPVTDGFAVQPSSELEARNYVAAINPGPYYTVQPYSWSGTTTYRYMVRSLVDQDLDLRLSAAAAAAGDRIQLSVNGVLTQTYDYATAASRDAANNFLYTDTAPKTIHLKAGINLIDLTLSNTNDGTTPSNAKAEINSLKFTPVGASLANTLPWVYGLPGNLQNTVSIVQSIQENTTTNFAVDIQDLETPAVVGQSSPFTITAVSSNPALLPNDASHISLSYNTSAVRWALGLTPVANMTGNVNLTVTITDPGGAKRTYVMTLNVVPASPTTSTVTATAATDGTVTVSWTNNSRVNPTFKIERSPVWSGGAWVQVGLTGATAYGNASWTDRPPAGASYYYRITAIDANGVTGNTVTANPIGTTYTYSPVTVSAQPTGGVGVSATSLLSGKTYFTSSTDVTSSGGGQTVSSAFDGTSQYFSFNATSNDSLAITGLNGATGIDTLKFCFPSTAGSQRMPAVSIYYSTTDYTSAGSSTALNSANYTRLGSSSYALYQSGASPVTTQPDGLQVATLSGLAIPAGVKSILFKFDASQANPWLAEIQAFASAGFTAPTNLAYTTAWQQFSPSSFANYVGATVTLTWSNPNDSTFATSSVVQRDTSTAFSGSNLRTWYTNLNATSFLNDRDNQNRSLNPYAPTWDTTNRNTPLAAGTTYYYRVGTRQADGSVVYGSPIAVTTASATYPIAATTGLTATAVSSYQINLTWNAVSGATGYKIEKSTRSDFRDTNYAMALVTGTSYSDPTVTPSSVWYYRVRAVGPNGDSSWATATATAQTLTAAPINLVAAADEGTIRLTWTPPTGKDYAYELYRGTTPDNLALYKSFAAGSSAVTWPTFFDTSLAPTTTYYYAVRGVYWSGNTNPSTLQYTSLSTVAFATTLASQTNSTPTLVTSASATPNLVTGTTTTLSVLGADADTGEASLTYTWAATVVPSGATVPTFSVNGTNAAKTTTVTFAQAGMYTFQVIVSDGESTAISSVSVAVAPGRPDLIDACDTGVNATDNLTNFNNADTPRRLAFDVSGTVAGATVSIWADGVQIGTAVAPAGGVTRVWTDAIVGHTLTEGSHGITARQVESGGLESPDSSALTIQIDTVAPRVMGVYVRGQAWKSEYLSYLVGHGLGDATLGYAIPKGNTQLDSLAWSSVNQVSLMFSEGVTVAAADLTVLGSTNGLTVPARAANGFSYDPVRFTATWTFSTSLPANKYLLALADTVTDRAGTRLDGEWTDGQSTVSGNGVAGGSFAYRLNVMPGDFNRSLSTSLVDYALVRLGTGRSTVDAAYDYRQDMDGSGSVSLVDVALTKLAVGTAIGGYADPVPPQPADLFFSALGNESGATLGTSLLGKSLGGGLSSVSIPRVY